MSAGHVALVLAAGGSARLGQPKQLLTRDGEALVHRAVRLAIESGASQTFVVIGAHAEAVIDAVRDLPCHAIENARWAEGLSSSLRCVASRLVAAGSCVLVLGCDQPAVDAAHLRVLLRRAVAAPSHCAATAYGSDPGIPAVVPVAWFGNIEAISGDRGFRARLRTLGDALPCVESATDLAFDIDRPGDLQRARELGLVDPC
jgi:molybdenum cofactor cytidylyltransferase